MKTHTRHVVTVTIVLAVLAIGAAAFIWSGIYNIGADDPHYKPTLMAITQLRERSIDARSRKLPVPALNDPARIKQGAANFNSMCAGCHLAPGGEATEIAQGLYPAPPSVKELASLSSTHAFWVIKHGLKMTGMPAWGVTMYDAALWDIVAALPKMATMTPAQYQTLIEGVDETGQKNPAPEADGETPAAAPMNTGAASADMRAMPGMKSMQGMKGMKGMDMGGQDVPATQAGPAKAPVELSLAGMQPKAAPAAEAVANAFRAALVQGDRKAALALLAPEVSIREGKEAQTRAQYASGHLVGDIAFLKTAQIKPVSIGSMSMGDTAMVGSRSEIRATNKGKPVSVLSTELMSLRKSPSGWLITKIEWASARLPN